MRIRTMALGACVCSLLCAPALAAERSLADLTLEELSEITITSVSRRPEALRDAPASVYVITAEDLRRSGARTLAEALRLAPNLQVARIDASQYAISARGFNNSIGNKLLVLIDGRTVYTPLFSGVFWDQQDVMLEDVERIEVVSGPGATLWGANAVNGVINVITKPAGETQGTLAAGGLGNRDAEGAVRYGGRLGDAGHYRVYAKTLRDENTRTSTGVPNHDGREWLQTGFRSDFSAGRNAVTLQGDAYQGRTEDRGIIGPYTLGRLEVSGMNLLGRVTRTLEGGSSLQVQTYLDHTERDDVVLLQPRADIFDVELQHSIPARRHQFVWGGGYRYGHDDNADAILATFRPPSRTLRWWNLFAQDTWSLTRTLALTAGFKVEHNDYTGAEALPNLRLAWKVAPAHLVWASVSRAVRAPSRYDRDVISPFFPSLGGPNFVSEVAKVYELGYRGQAGGRFTYSATLFRHDWDKLRSGTTLPLELENRISGAVYGLEAWGTLQAARNWRLSGGLMTLAEPLHLEPGSTDPVGVENVTLRNDPSHQWMLRSSLDLSPRQLLDAELRHVARLPNPPVPAYTAFDLRYAFRVRRDVELSVTATNLFDPGHVEFRTSNLPGDEVERSIFFAVRFGS